MRRREDLARTAALQAVGVVQRVRVLTHLRARERERRGREGDEARASAHRGRRRIGAAAGGRADGVAIVAADEVHALSINPRSCDG